MPKFVPTGKSKLPDPNTVYASTSKPPEPTKHQISKSQSEMTRLQKKPLYGGTFREKPISYNYVSDPYDGKIQKEKEYNKTFKEKLVAPEKFKPSPFKKNFGLFNSPNDYFGGKGGEEKEERSKPLYGAWKAFPGPKEGYNKTLEKFPEYKEPYK